MTGDLSPSTHQIPSAGCMVIRGAELMRIGVLIRLQACSALPTGTLPGCRALPRPPPAVSPCSRPQGSPTICILHMGLQMGREVTVRSCSGICYEAPGGERATGDNHIALGSLAEMYTADGCVSWPLQPCLIFLASLKRVLHKFSWPGKFLRGQ